MVHAHAVACVLSAAVLLAASPAAAWGQGEWVNARATFYGRDAWSIHTGSCGFGFICPNRWAGQLKDSFDVVAISDKSPLYNPQSSCGQCLEVSCRDAFFGDYFGSRYDRRGMCKGSPGSKHVKVKIVDTCPCDYAGNAQSNKRWCCGDMPHLDMSQWALEKITSDTSKWGVFAIKYRQVSCSAAVQKEAPNPSNKPSDPHSWRKPASLDCSKQGLATESGGGTRAKVPSKKKRTTKKPTKKPTPKRSKKFLAMLKAYGKASQKPRSAQYYRDLKAYFRKYDKNMKLIKKGK